MSVELNNNLDLTIGFIGGGNMAKAIAHGILKKGLVNKSQIIVSSPSDSTLEGWKELSSKGVHSNTEVVRDSDIVFLTFKPYQLDTALQREALEIPGDTKSKLFVSVLAGVTCEVLYAKLTSFIQCEPRIIRVMPNTPAMVCEGCSAIAPYKNALQKDVDRVKKIFSSLGVCEIVPEYLMPSVTGLTGSGPAYIFSIIEALSDGGVKQGIPRDIATTFAAQTVLGAAKMVLETKKHPGQLKDEVCSAGGTTIYGIHALEKGGLRATLMNAVEAATQRGEEMGRAAAKK